MWRAHEIGYGEYCRHHSARMKVEKRREKDYNKGRQMAADFNRPIYFNNQFNT